MLRVKICWKDRLLVAVFALVMYRKYVQNLPPQSALAKRREDASFSDSSNEDLASESETDAKEQSFPEPHIIVGEAHLKAAKSVRNESSPNLSEGRVSHSSWTFDPGGHPESKVRRQKFFLDDIIDGDKTPEFRRPPANRESCPPSILCNGNRHQPVTVKQPSPSFKLWGPEGLATPDNGLMLLKPIEDSLGLPLEKLMYQKTRVSAPPIQGYPFGSKKEIIRVMPADSEVSARQNGKSYRSNGLKVQFEEDFGHGQEERQANGVSGDSFFLSSDQWTSNRKKNQVTNFFFLVFFFRIRRNYNFWRKKNAMQQK